MPTVTSNGRVESKLHRVLNRQLNARNIFNGVLAVQSGDGKIS